MYVKNMIIAMQNISNKYNEKIKCNHIEKSIKVPFVIQADLEFLLEKIDTCYSNPERSSTTKIYEHT